MVVTAFNGSVSLPVAGYNYNSGWISFCWRDSHPLEWQLASLHGQLETPKHVRAGGSFRRKRASGRDRVGGGDDAGRPQGLMRRWLMSLAHGPEHV